MFALLCAITVVSVVPSKTDVKLLLLALASLVAPSKGNGGRSDAEPEHRSDLRRSFRRVLQELKIDPRLNIIGRTSSRSAGGSGAAIATL